MKSRTRKTLFSGVQPSGELMIGNYLGALRNWASLIDEYDCLFSLVDLHAVTVYQEPKSLLRRCREFVALLIACGIDPGRSTMFVQSHVPAHAELAWVLNCTTYMGELSRMTQFKEKKQRQKENVNVGLFDYPVLMAADILLYGTDLVPVGEDQKQHLELTRDVAERFNSRFGAVFTIPEGYIPEVGGRIMSLQDPSKKMSKSDANPDNYIALLDPPDIIRRKIRSAVTDSGKEVRFDPERKPGISNLMAICSALTGKTTEEVETEFEGKGYGAFKETVSDILMAHLDPIQGRYRAIMEDSAHLSAVLESGAASARHRAAVMMEKVHERLGFVPRHTGRGESGSESHKMRN